jgi:hypothetical protein
MMVMAAISAVIIPVRDVTSNIATEFFRYSSHDVNDYYRSEGNNNR